VLDKQLVQKLHRLSLVSQRSLLNRTPGEHHSERKGASLEFADYRPYVAGDDLRRIDWNIYARLEKLVIKVTEAQEAATCICLLDISPQWIGARLTS